MKNVLNHLFENKTLSREVAKEVLVNIAGSKYNDAQTSAFLTVYLMRSITTEELMGFRDALLDLCRRIDLSDYDIIDLCGTGGDNKNTFNISTTASFIVAGAGYKVVKHGNYAVSSSCGSSNLMEFFGYKFTDNITQIRKEIDGANICFLHAPLFHPAMKIVAPIRKQLGVKTFFNMLGPMVNPAFPKYQMVGVFNLELARMYNYIYQLSDKNYAIVHGLDGYDEISLTGDFKVFKRDAEFIYSPDDINFHKIMPEELYGGVSVRQAAGIFTDIMNGNATNAQINSVIANAAIAINTLENNKTLQECIEIANESLISGNALKAFNKLINMSAH